MNISGSSTILPADFMPPTAAEACVPTSLTHADVVRLREEVGVAVASKDKSSLHRRWLEACHTRVHGVVCQVEDVLHDCV